jgi:excisionase family DNA binding protein
MHRINLHQVVRFGTMWEIWQILQSIANDCRGNSMANAKDEILTLDDVVAYLKAGKRTVYRLAASKKIPAFKVGGSWRFSRTEIDLWIKQQSTEGLPSEMTDGKSR